MFFDVKRTAVNALGFITIIFTVVNSVFLWLIKVRIYFYIIYNMSSTMMLYHVVHYFHRRSCPSMYLRMEQWGQKLFNVLIHNEVRFVK
jgi:serine acetyltransferase